MDREKAIWACEEIARDMERDAQNFDGQPFTGKTVAEYMGNQGAAIAALANITKSLLAGNRDCDLHGQLPKPEAPTQERCARCGHGQGLHGGFAYGATKLACGGIDADGPCFCEGFSASVATTNAKGEPIEWCDVCRSWTTPAPNGYCGRENCPRPDGAL